MKWNWILVNDDHNKKLSINYLPINFCKKIALFSNFIPPLSFSSPNKTYELLGIHCVKIGEKMKMLSNPLFVLWEVLSSLYSNASCVCVYFVVKGGIIFGWEH